MNDGRVSSLNPLSAGEVDRSADLIEIAHLSVGESMSITPNALMGVSSNPVGISDSQTLTNKTISGSTNTLTNINPTNVTGLPSVSSIVTLTGTQTLTNKTLTSPTINTPTISNASITQNSVVGFTTTNTGTVYGIPITAGSMSGANLTVNTVPGSTLTNASVGPSKLATGASQAYVATPETTASTTYADLTTTTDSVTVTIGNNGIALVVLSSYMGSNTNTALVFVSFAISGATTQAANDNLAVEYQTFAANALGTYGSSFIVTGLTPGSTTFKMKYRTNSGTATFQYRRIGVVPL